MARPKMKSLAVFVGALLSGSAVAQILGEAPLGEAVERHFTGDEPLTEWTTDAEFLATERGDSLEMREVDAEQLETVKLTGLVPPIGFESGVADIPDSTVTELSRLLEMQPDVTPILHALEQP